MNYSEKAKEARRKTLDLIYRAQSSHIGSNLSAIDIFTVLFDKADPSKDEVILSAGWKAAAWYFFLWKKGIITEDELNSYCQEGSQFIGLIEPMGRWGLKCAGGSMGYGIAFGVGMALAKKIKKEAGTVYVVMSDGEQAIGTTWESAAFAAHHGLDNLVVIVDKNELQAMGKTKEILDMELLWQKWEAFNWDSRIFDGHNFEQIEEYLDMKRSTPRCLIANTTKGRGVSFMENKLEWHYRNIPDDLYEQARKELV